MRGADVGAVRERREALHVHAEQPRERVRLGLAELGELPGDVLHRAVPLAQLRAEAGYAGCGGAGRRGVPVGGEAVGQGAGPRLGSLAGGLDPGSVVLLELPGALLGEGADRLSPEGGAQVAAGRTTPGRRTRPTSSRGPARWRRNGGRGGRGRGGRRGTSQTATSPSAASASRWRRTAAGVRPSRSARTARAHRPLPRARPGRPGHACARRAPPVRPRARRRPPCRPP